MLLPPTDTDAMHNALPTMIQVSSQHNNNLPLCLYPLLPSLLPALFLAAVRERCDRQLWRGLEVVVVAQLGVLGDAEFWEG